MTSHHRQDDMASTSGHQKNIGLDTGPVRNSIMRFLTRNINDLNEHHEIITDTEALDVIRSGNYVVCPRITGSRTWVVFFIKDNVHYAVNFPKHHRTRREQTRFYPIISPVSPSYYLGTIMEGVYYRHEDRQYLVIDEVYLLAGVDQMTKMKEDRLQDLHDSFRTSVNNSASFSLHVAKPYMLTEESLTDLYEKIKTDPLIRELTFYPRIYGNTIYTYPISDQDVIDQTVVHDVFHMRRGKHVDLYHLEDLEGEKIGIACIPTTAISKMCKQWFKENRKKKLLVKCSMGSANTVSDQWVPISLVDEEDLEENDDDDSFEEGDDIELDEDEDEDEDDE